MLRPSKSPSSGFRWRALEIAIRLHGGSADGERATRLLAGAERARCAWAVRRLISQMGTSLQCRATFHKAVSVDRLSFSRRTAQSGKAPERPATGVASELCTSGRNARGRHDASSGAWALCGRADWSEPSAEAAAPGTQPGVEPGSRWSTL